MNVSIGSDPLTPEVPLMAAFLGELTFLVGKGLTYFRILEAVRLDNAQNHVSLICPSLLFCSLHFQSLSICAIYMAVSLSAL
jgi:hypothetical protein